MTADQIIAFADALRETARASGRDINAANLFVHTVLARAIRYDEGLPHHLAAMASIKRHDRPGARP